MKAHRQRLSGGGHFFCPFVYQHVKDRFFVSSQASFRLIDAAKVQPKSAPAKKNTTRWDFAGVFVGVSEKTFVPLHQISRSKLSSMHYAL